LFVVAVLGLTLVSAGTSPVIAAKPKKPKKPQVTLSVPSKGEVGKALKVDVVVKRGVKGQKVTLQRLVGTTWTKDATAKLPKKGKKKSVTFTVTPTAAGTLTYRAELAEKKTTKGATSSTAQVVVAAATDGPLTLTVSTSTSNEQTKVTFSGVLSDAPAGSSVQIQYARGRNPTAGAWTTATTVAATGAESPYSYSGNVTIPVVRNRGDNGAPQLNIRAVAAGATSPMASRLVRTVYQGTYVQYDNDGEIAGQDTFVVIYSDRTWYMNFGTIRVTGTTDGWDLVDKGGARFATTFHQPGFDCEAGDTPPDCPGYSNVPWISIAGTFAGGGEGETIRIEGSGGLT
jgi:hypothetical protein